MQPIASQVQLVVEVQLGGDVRVLVADSGEAWGVRLVQPRVLVMVILSHRRIAALMLGHLQTALERKLKEDNAARTKYHEDLTKKSFELKY